METFYRLADRYDAISGRYEALRAELEQMYEENEGEITEETEEMERVAKEIDALREGCIREILDNSDAYAEIALNKEAQRKVAEAEVKAVREEQRKILERCQARERRLASSVEFWKQNFDAAMRMAEIVKVGGAKTDKRHSIYYHKSRSVEVTDEEALLRQSLGAIEEFRQRLPKYISFALKIDKAELKRMSAEGVELPEGVDVVETQSIVIR